MSTAPLPKALENVRVPRFLSPSRFADLCRCKLSVIGSDADGALPVSSLALLGTVLHYVVAEVGEGRWGSAPNSGTAFDEILNNALTTLGPSAGPIQTAIGRQRWTSRVNRARTWATEDAPAASIGPPHPLQIDIKTEGPSHPRIDRGNEAWVVWPARRLRGRADRIESVGAHLRVVENKSGEIFDRAGKLLEGAGLQLSLYALAIEAVAGVQAEPIIRAGETVLLPWDDEARKSTSETLYAMLSQLPAGAELAASELASPGRHCLHCRLRPVCVSYLAGAPRLWMQSNTSGRMPLDAWGEILSVISNADGGIRVELRDAADRFVVISGLSPEWGLQDSRPGDRVYFFDLETDQDRQHMERVQPTNFREEAPHTGTGRRAFALRVFRS